MAADGSVIIQILGDATDFEKSLTGLQKSASSAGLGAAAALAGVSAALAAIGTAAVAASAEYETSLAKVSTIADTNAKSIGTLSSEIMALSNETGEAATGLNEALYSAISAGADTAHATELVGVAVKAARGGFTDTETAVDGLTSALNAYGMATTEAEGLANKFLVTQNLGKTTFGELASSIGQVAPTAKAAGVSIDDLLASLASLTANGIGTSEAMTGMKSALSNVIKPTSDAAKMAEQLGLDFSAAALRSKGWAAFLRDIQEKTGGNTEQMAALFGSVEALNTVLTLTSRQGMSLMDKTLNEMAANTTALDDAYESMSDTLDVATQKLGTNVQNLGVAIGDALAPALTVLAEAVASVVAGVTEFVEQNPLVVNAMAGVTVATATLAAGLLVCAKAEAAAAAASGALKAAHDMLTAHPVLLVAAAAAGLAVALGTVIASAVKAGDEMAGLSEEARKAKQAFQETNRATQEQSESTLSMVSALEAAVSQEEKTAAQKAAILDMVDRLNEAVPGLSLAYDEQTDSLNMTTEAIRALVQAEKDRAEQEARVAYLTALYEDQQELLVRLAGAKEAVAKAEDNVADAAGKSRRMQETAQNALITVRANLERYTEELEANRAEVERAEQEYNALTSAADGLSGSTAGLTQRTVSLTEAVSGIRGGYELLRQAQDEVNDSGSISIDTLDQLLAQYPELGDYLVETENGYRLTNGALQDYIATQRAEYQLAYDNAAAAAQDIVDAEMDKRGAIVDTTQSIKNQIKALIGFYGAAVDAMSGLQGLGDDAASQRAEQRAARKVQQLKAIEARLEAADQNLSTFDRGVAMLDRETRKAGSSGGGSSGAGSPAREAAEKERTAAEKNLEAFREVRKELDHQRAMEEISEEAFRERLAKLRDEYLLDEENVDAYRDVQEEIFRIDKSLAKEQETLWQEQTDSMLDGLRERLNAVAETAKAELGAIREEIERVEALRDAMSDKLTGYGDLFTTKENKRGDTKYSLTDLQAQIDAQLEFERVLSELGTRNGGISDSLMSEILSMGVDDAVGFGNELLNLSDKQWDDYNAKWAEKQENGKRIADEFYGDELDGLNAEFDEKLSVFTAKFQELTPEMQDAGEKIMSGLDDGLKSKWQDVLDTAGEISASIVKAFREALDIHSPSRKLAKLVGVPSAEGVGAGFEEAYPGVMARLRDTVEAETLKMSAQLSVTSNKPSDPGSASTQRQLEQLAGLLSMSGSGNREIVLKLNGIEVARAIVDDLRDVEDQSPRIKSD